MTFIDDYPFLRQVKSPITDDQLRPLDSRCKCVQFCSRLTESDHSKLAEFLGNYPKVHLRVYGHYSLPLPNLSFLRHYPFLSGFQVDVYNLDSTQGIEELTDSLEFFAFGRTKTQRISLDFIKRFSRLNHLHLEGHTKNLDVISSLSCLEELTLRSITLPDLTLLLPLKNLWSLDIKLGGTKDLRLLPLVGKLKYLELWMIRGLQDLSVIGEVTTLQNLFLQALKNVTTLPSFGPLQRLRCVTLDTMKGLTNLSPVAEAPALEELRVIDGRQWKPEDFKPFLGHPTLKAIGIGLGSLRKNHEVDELLGLPTVSSEPFVYV